MRENESFVFSSCQFSNILYKYGWDDSLDNNFICIYMKGVVVIGVYQFFCNEIHLAQILLYIKLNFAVVFSHYLN